MSYISDAVGLTDASNTALDIIGALGTAGQVLRTNLAGTALEWVTLGTGGTVTSVSVVTANGISGSVATATTTPAITLTLGSITPSAVQISGLTASEIVGTDASKNLVSLAVATYPSLTELTYVKGVTSAIQTQFTGKAATTLANLASVAINTTLVSDTDNTDALGTSAIAWSDIFLGSGAVITFNSAPSTADITITHALDTLTFAGGTIALGTATATGGLTGNVTGDVSGSAATVTGAAQTAITSLGTLTILAVDNITINGNDISSTAGIDLTITPLAGQQIVLDGTIVIDAGVVTGATSITSTTFVGALTGDASGSAATVTGAAQTAITSLGTLTTLTVDDITINGNTISSAGASTLAITPTAGQAITFDGTVTLDAGVVAGITSLTINNVGAGSDPVLDSNSASQLLNLTGTLNVTSEILCTNLLATSVNTDGFSTTAAAAAQFLTSSNIQYSIRAAIDTITLTANSSAFKFISDAEAYTEAGSGTHAVIGGVGIRAPVITDGAGATTNAVTLYVEGAPTGTATPTNVYAVWVDAGAVRIDGTIELGAASDTTLSRSAAGVVSIEGVNILTVAGGTLTGSLALGESTSIKLGGIAGADGTFTGTTITGTAGTTIVAGNLCYLAVADSKWELTDADAVATSGNVMIAIATAAIAENASGEFLVQGIITETTASLDWPALTIGAAVYVGETPGTVQTAIPTGADAVIRVIGFATAADEIFFCPSSDHQTVVA